MSSADRAAVVAAARSWLGTPYHHAADLRGIGVDCGMLLVRVFVDLALVEPFDPRPYSRYWYLHQDGERYLEILLGRTRPVDSPESGDIVLFRVGRCFSHGGIVTRAHPLTILHASAPARCVLEEDVARNAALAERLPQARYFSHWTS